MSNEPTTAPTKRRNSALVTIAKMFAGGSTASWIKLDELPPESAVGASRMLTQAERDALRGYYLSEEAWSECKTLVFFPVSGYKQAWDFLVMICVLYSSYILPYRIVFEDATGAAFWFEASVHSFFLVDVMVSFNTAHLDGERWIVHRPWIAAAYLKGWFWVDFPSAVPTELIEHYFLVGSEEAPALHLMPLVRTLRLFRLLRLLRLLRLGDVVMMVEDRFGINLKGLRMYAPAQLRTHPLHLPRLASTPRNGRPPIASSHTGAQVLDGGAAAHLLPRPRVRLLLGVRRRRRKRGEDLALVVRRPPTMAFRGLRRPSPPLATLRRSSPKLSNLWPYPALSRPLRPSPDLSRPLPTSPNLSQPLAGTTVATPSKRRPQSSTCTSSPCYGRSASCAARTRTSSRRTCPSASCR